MLLPTVISLLFLAVKSVDNIHENSFLADDIYTEALQYLGRYGYLTNDQQTNFSLFDSFEKSLKGFQSFFGLKVSGKLDNQTVNTMRKPRCGVGDEHFAEGEVKEIDLMEDRVRSRKKRYSFYDSFFFNDIMDLFGTRIRPFDTPSR